MLGPEHVLITDADGRVEGIVPLAEAGEDIQQTEGVLSPGFINCHCHLELSHMKGLIPEHTGLVDFVFKVVTQRHFPDEEIADAIAIAEKEMLTNGIVAVGDICNNLSTLPQKQKNQLNYYNFIEVSGWLPSVAQQRFEKSLSYYNAFHQPQTPNPKLQTALSPHAPYSVSNELWALLSPYFEEKTVTIHNQETAFEDTLFLNGGGDFSRMYQMMKLDTSFFNPTGKSSLQSYLSNMRLAKQVILIHNTFIKEADIEFAARVSAENNQPIYYGLCVNANLYIENMLPPVELLRKHNTAIVVGTDSLASNHSLSILDELKTISKHFPSIPLSELLQWATSNGAKALQLDDQLGSFEKGKTPGVVTIEQLNNGAISQNTSIKRLM